MRVFTGLRLQHFPWITSVLALLILPSYLHADTTSASLSVEVTDTTGAVIPEATVDLRNAATNQKQEAVTGQQGTVLFSFLKPGQYGLLVERTGFEDVRVTDIVLNIGDQKHLQLVLKVGSAAQTVTVNGSGLNINTTDGSVSTVVDRNFVENMPLNGRSFQDLILLAPGTVTTSPQYGGGNANGFSGEFSVNGQRTESNVYTVDGINANTGGNSDGYGTAGTSGSLPAATTLGTTQSLVSIDDLQEFRVNTSSYSAEYGLSPGGQFSFETRSGTNEGHGSAFDYLRNDALDANNWFNDYTTPVTRKPAERQNDFGGTLGGRLLIPHVYNGKNRSFFFFSYEGLRLTEPQAALTTYVPSTALRDAAPTAVQPLMNAFPLPTGAPLSNGLAPFVGSYSLPSSLDSTSIRFDEQLTARLKLFYRFSSTHSDSQSRYQHGLSEVTSSNQSNHTNTLGLTSAISKSATNDFRLNYTSSTGSFSSIVDGFGGATPVDLRALQGIATTTSPQAAAGFALFFSGYEAQMEQGATDQPQHAWNVNDKTIASVRGNTWTFGADFRRISSQILPESPYVSSTFTSSAAVLADQTAYGLAQVTAQSDPVYDNIAIFAQDEMEFSHRLHVSLGLRWEVNPPPSVISGTLPYVAQGNISDPPSLHLAPANTRFWNTTYYNFAPRVGFAYRIHSGAGRETALKAGAGVFFDSGQQDSTQAFSQDIGETAYGLYLNSSYPLTPAQLNVSVVDPPIPPYEAPAYYFPTHLQLPYTLQWNVSIERALGAQQILTISYVGSNGRRLMSQQLVYPAAVAFNADGIYMQTSGTTSSYNALQVKFQRALSRGLQILGSYNWSHSIDFGSQDLNFPQIRGNSDFDVRNNFNLAATYDFPAIHSDGVLARVANRWSLDTRFSARTGFPVILDGNQIILPGGQAAYQGLNLVPGVPVYLNVDGIPGNRQINPAAFSLPASDAYGNAPRNFVRGFGMNQLDFAVRRSFSMGDHLNLQFRAETFNLINHPDFGYIYPYYGGVLFGQATETLNGSLHSLSALYQQGGARSMQLSMKLQF